MLGGIVTASPKNATAANYSRLAAALDRLDDSAGALAATEKGLALEPRNFDLLAQRWDLLAARKRWDDALALYPALLAAAPGVYYVEQVQARHIAALSAAGKLPEARGALAARLTPADPAKNPPLDENELCLLIRMDIQGGDTHVDDPDNANAVFADARRALAQGKERFPRSVALVRAEVELARRAHDPAAQVGALRRLAELQPAQKTDTLEQIVRVWRDANHPDDAIAAARELVAASPASAPAHLLLADLLLLNNRPDEGLSYLREAVRLGDRPNDVRLRLASAQSDLGRNADARKTLDEAFEAAGDAHERLTMTKGLAEAYQREGKLDELIARFQHLQQAEADGWRYALYLAEIYETTQDTEAARRELSKALSSRPKDGSLLRQLVRLAASEGNAAEFARYQRQLTEVEPSDLNQVALVKALLANDEADAALDALQAHVAAIVKVPGAWDELLPLLTQKALSGKAGDILTRELGGEKADARNRFTLALFQMTAGHLDEAKAALWGIFALRAAPAAPATAKPPVIPAAAPDEAYMVFYGEGGTVAEQRLADAVRGRTSAQTLLDPESASNGQSLGIQLATGTSTATAGHPDPLDSLRDTALVYLAAIAVKQDAAAPFLAELVRQLAARESSRLDRLVAYASVDATDPLLGEIAAQARSPESALDIFCAGQLFTIASSNQQTTNGNTGAPAETTSKLTPTQIDAMGPLAEVFFRRVALARPETAEIIDVMRNSFYGSLGLKAKADEIKREFLARINDHSSVTLLGDALDLLMEGDLGPEDRAQVRTFVRAMAAQTSHTHNVNVRQAAFNVPQSLLSNTDSPASKLPPADLGALLADLMVLWYPADPPPVPGTPVPPTQTTNQPRQWVANGVLNVEGDYLPPLRYLDAEVNSAIEQVENQLHEYKDEDKAPALHAAVHDALARQSRELPAAQRLYPLMVSLYMDTCGGDNVAALATARELLAARRGDTDVRLLTAILLARNDQAPEAIALLKDTGEVRDPEAARYVQYGILTFAQDSENIVDARAAALRLAAMRVPQDERDELAAKLRALDLTKEADQFEHSSPSAASQAVANRRHGMPGRGSILEYETVEQLQALERDKNPDAALVIVRNVLAALPPSGQNADQADSVVESALSVLDRLHKRDEFVAEARKQLAGDPDSLSLNYQLAMLCGPRGAILRQNDYRIRRTDAPPPVWVRLARNGDEITGSYSSDGKRWVRLGRKTVPLGDAPEAVLAATGWGDPSVGEPSQDVVFGQFTRVPEHPRKPSEGRAVGATVDSVTFPAQDGGPAWTATPPPAVEERAGVFTLHGGDNGQPTPDWDTLPSIHRPLGAAQEFTARVMAFDSADGHRAAVGALFRASLAPDAAFAAVLVGEDGSTTFVTRQGPDPALPYWRKLTALRPKESRYARLLAARYAEVGKWSEAAAIYDGLFAGAPDEIINHYGEISNFYQHDAVRLATLLLQWKPGPSNGRSGNASALYTDTARKCAAIHRDDLVVDLSRRAVELNAALGNRADTTDHEAMLEALARLGRRDEARDELLKLFVPPSVQTVAAGTAAPRLGFESPQTRAATNGNYVNWLAGANWVNDVPVLPGLSVLEAVQPLGLLPELEAALRARLAEPDGQQFVHGMPDWIITFSRVYRHDPTVLAELPALLNSKEWISDEAINSYPLGGVTLRIALARLLEAWPGHETLALEALRFPDALRKKMSGQGSEFSAMYDLLAARTAARLGDPVTATAIARAVSERLVPVNKRHGPASFGPPENFDFQQVQACLAVLLRVGTPEADRAFVELYDRVAKFPEQAKELDDSYAPERKLRAGDHGPYLATARVLDGGAQDDGGEATLVYELHLRGAADVIGPHQLPESSGRSVAAAEGERTLTFSYGRDSRHFEVIGQLKTAATFGTWRGPVPPGTGLLKVSVDAPRATDAKETALGDFLSVVRAPNLWVNAELEGLPKRDPNARTFSLPGWKELPAGFWLQGTLNSPVPGKPYVQCETGQRTEQTVYGDPVPVEMGHAYFQSGWLRETGEGSSVHVGRRYLNGQGKILGTTECPDGKRLNWRRPAQTLGTTHIGPGVDLIPAGTAFIEPFVRFEGAVDWTGLFLGRAD